jgi:hypothetical protein
MAKTTQPLYKILYNGDENDYDVVRLVKQHIISKNVDNIGTILSGTKNQKTFDMVEAELVCSSKQYDPHWEGVPNRKFFSTTVFAGATKLKKTQDMTMFVSAATKTPLFEQLLQE